MGAGYSDRGRKADPRAQSGYPGSNRSVGTSMRGDHLTHGFTISALNCQCDAAGGRVVQVDPSTAVKQPGRADLNREGKASKKNPFGTSHLRAFFSVVRTEHFRVLGARRKRVSDDRLAHPSIQLTTPLNMNEYEPLSFKTATRTRIYVDCGMGELDRSFQGIMRH